MLGVCVNALIAQTHRSRADMTTEPRSHERGARIVTNEQSVHLWVDGRCPDRWLYRLRAQAVHSPPGRVRDASSANPLRTAWMRDVTLSFSKMFFRCHLIVSGATRSARAISLFESPRAT